MARPKGQPKIGGRKKGTPNRRTRELLEIFEKHDFCPVEALIEGYRDARKEYERSAEIYDAIQEKRSLRGINVPLKDTAPEYLKIANDAAKELISYAFPKRKAIEIMGKDGGPLDVYLRMTPEQRADRIKAFQDRLIGIPGGKK